MESIILSEIFIYPVKSLGGIALTKTEIVETGLKYDRIYMLVDENNKYITQRTCPRMSLLRLSFSNDGFEDTWDEFIINGLKFNAVKPCSRCVITTVDPDTGIKGKEPLATLASYRTIENSVMFGQNVLHSNLGVIKVGDSITINSYRTSAK